LCADTARLRSGDEPRGIAALSATDISSPSGRLG
jgi:hypothetical protein